MRYLVLSLLLAASLSLADNTYRLALFTEGGAPAGGPADTRVLVNTAYAIGYSDVLKNPLWAVYRLGNHRHDQGGTDWERPARFLVDSRTDARVDHDDYTGSGYDRGHMVPNSAMGVQYGQLSQLETYFMSNISPQSPSLNRGLWASLEGHIRDTVSQDDTPGKEVHDAWVIVGPVFDGEIQRMKSGVAIPTHFYKIVAYRKGYRGTVWAKAWLIPQQPQHKDVDQYRVTIDHIEDKTGLDFFAEFSERRQKNLESSSIHRGETGTQ